MKCPTCGQSKLVHDTRDVPYTYKGESITLPAVTGDFCPTCDESILANDESARVSAIMLSFNKQVNGFIVDPIFITRVRKKLNLDQHKAAELFGGGVNAFSRYENGKTKPPLSLVQLFRVLDRHPKLLEEVTNLSINQDEMIYTDRAVKITAFRAKSIGMKKLIPISKSQKATSKTASSKKSKASAYRLVRNK
jgi:HTH-type transcriptional regulator/antitoxin MqsA